MAEAKGLPEKVIQSQVDTNEKDVRATSTLKAEQAIRDEIPNEATLVRGYAKWTDNDGNFRKVSLDGTNAIREPAHEQHELTLEDRDRLYEAVALKTPRRDNAKALEGKDVLHEEELRNDEVHQDLADEPSRDSIEPQEGPVVGPDDHPDFGKNDGEVSDEFKTPGK